MTTQLHTTHEYIDEPFSEVVAYSLDHRELVLEIRITPDPKQPPHIAIADEHGRCRWKPSCEMTITTADEIKAYHYERIRVESSEEYTYWLRLVIVDATALVPRDAQFTVSDYIAKRREYWIVLARLEQVREVPMSTLPIRKLKEWDNL